MLTKDQDREVEEMPRCVLKHLTVARVSFHLHCKRAQQRRLLNMNVVATLTNCVPPPPALGIKNNICYCLSGASSEHCLDVVVPVLGDLFIEGGW